MEHYSIVQTTDYADIRFPVHFINFQNDSSVEHAIILDVTHRTNVSNLSQSMLHPEIYTFAYKNALSEHLN